MLPHLMMRRAVVKTEKLFSRRYLSSSSHANKTIVIGAAGAVGKVSDLLSKAFAKS